MNKEKRDKAVAFMEKMLEKVKTGEATVTRTGEDCQCPEEEDNIYEEKLADGKSPTSKKEETDQTKTEKEEERESEEEAEVDVDVESEELVEGEPSEVTLSRDDIQKILKILGL